MDKSKSTLRQVMAWWHQAITWAHVGQVHWCIVVSKGAKEWTLSLLHCSNSHFQTLLNEYVIIISSEIQRQIFHNAWLKINQGQAITCMDSPPPGQYGRHFSHYIFRSIFMNEKLCILIPISLRFVPKCPVDNKSALVQVMAWRKTGDMPLPEPMLTQFTNAYMWH